MGTTINIKKIIDASTSIQPASQARRDFSKAIFVQTGVGYTDTVRSYTTSSDIARDLGSNSEAYKASLKWFSGGFNGIKPTQLYVGLVNTSAATESTKGNFTTGNVSANLAALIAVDDGEFTIAKDGGTAVNVTNIDLTSASTFEEIATLLQNYITMAGILNVIVTYNSTSHNFVLESQTYGTTSDVVITAYVGSGTDLTGAALLNGGTATVGTDGTLAATIADFLSDNRYYQIILSNQWTEDQAKQWISAIEAATKITYLGWYQSDTAEIKSQDVQTDTTSIAAYMFAQKINKTSLVYADTLTDYDHVSMASYFGIVDFTAARPLGCLAFKQFSGQTPSVLTDANFDNLNGKNVNFYAVYGETGRNISYGGKVPSGSFINDVLFADWCDYDMTYNIFDWMIKRPKLAYTTDDFAQLSAIIEQTPVTAIGFGAISGGTDPDTGENLINGYKVTIPTPASISTSDKSQGILKGIEVVMLLSGSVTKIVITNTLKI
jgi:hypothetical protein